MFRLRYSVSSAVFSLTWIHALAGSQAWQPRFQQKTDLDEFVYGNNSSPQLVRRLDKRYVTMDPNEPDATQGLWPGGVVIYCWDGNAAEKVGDDLRDALRLWHDNGLSSSFDWKEHDDCGSALRSEYIKIVFDANKGNGCTVGKANVGQNAGGTLTLNGRADVGHLNVVVNTAHEMGHAWGLYHEHQNPFLWPNEYSENGGGNVFGTAKNPFKCSNLADYAAAKASYKNKNPYFSDDALEDKMQNIVCKRFKEADALDFSAKEYLPDPARAIKVRTDKKAIDWLSIMIYPTGAGGGPNRNPVLGKEDGSPIPVVKAPSSYDVSGLEKLYGVQKSKKFTPLGEKSNPKKSVFDKILRKNPDSGCA